MLRQKPLELRSVEMFIKNKFEDHIKKFFMEDIDKLLENYAPGKPEMKPDVLKQLKDSGIRTKSGIMLGLGETQEEIYKVMDDLRSVNCDVMTLGQYLQPTKNHLEIKEWIKPEVFKHYEEIGLKKGFRFVESGPLVRSSYHAEKHIL